MSRSMRDLPRRLEVPQVTIEVLGDTWRAPTEISAGSYQAPITQLAADQGYSREGLLLWLDQHCPDFKVVHDLHATLAGQPEIPWEDHESQELWISLIGL